MRRYAKAIQEAEQLFVSAVTVLETGMVIRARAPAAAFQFCRSSRSYSACVPIQNQE